MFLNKRKD